MMLFVDGVNRGIRCTLVGFWVADYEAAFSLLTKLVRDKWVLEQAVIIDGYHRVSLPVAAFDGQPILGPIQALQAEWQRLLFVPG